VDRYILNGYTGAEHVAILGLAARVTMILGVVAIAPIGLTYTPFIFATARRKDAQAVFERARTYMGVLVAGSALALALFARDRCPFAFAPPAAGWHNRPHRPSLRVSPQLEIGITPRRYS
jgi:O-antigen/teichoic acid export membrane protein